MFGAGVGETGGEKWKEMQSAGCSKAVRRDESLDFGDSVENGKSDRQEKHQGKIINRTQ